MRKIAMTTFGLLVALSMTIGPAIAIEINFSTKLLSPDGTPYRDCKEWDRSNPSEPKCKNDEWIEHTLGLIAFGALHRPEPKAGNAVEGSIGALLENARRGALAERVYKGGVIDLNSKEIDQIIEAVAKLQLPSVELLRLVELLDAARLRK